MGEIEFSTIIIAALASFVVGMLWYSPLLFLKPWKRHMKIGASDEKKFKEKGMKSVMIIGFLSDILMAYGFSLLLALAIASPFYVAFVTWLGFVLVVMISSTIYENKPWPLLIINSGYRLVSMMAMAVVFFYL
jgi:hypothetical protein